MKKNLFDKGTQVIKAVDGISFSVREAVKLSFERLVASSPFSTNAGEIENIEVLSEHSFKIKWKNQFAPFFINATTPFLAPLDVTVLGADGEGFEKNPSGSGPLKLVEIKRGDSPDKKVLIIEKAVELFAKNGFESTSVQEIQGYLYKAPKMIR